MWNYRKRLGVSVKNLMIQNLIKHKKFLSIYNNLFMERVPERFLLINK